MGGDQEKLGGGKNFDLALEVGGGAMLHGIRVSVEPTHDTHAEDKLDTSVFPIMGLVGGSDKKVSVVACQELI